MKEQEQLEKLKLSHERLRALYQVGSVIHSTLDSQEALQLIVSEAVRVMHASSGSLVLINPTSGFLEIHAAQNLSASARKLKLRVGEGLTGWVAQTGKPARVGDVSLDKRYVSVRRDVRSELAVPLEVQGEVRGVINVDSERVDAFSEDDLELLQELAIQAAKVIHHTWLYEQLRLKVMLFESLSSVSRTINSTLNLDEALRAITKEACELMRARMCSLMLLDESREWLDLRASFGAGDAYINKPRLAAGESLIGVVVRRKKPLQVANVQTDTRYQNVELARRESLVSLLSVPLIFAGQCIGALSVYTARPYSFSNEEIKILSALAELSAIAIEKARLYERVVDVEEQLRQNEKLSALGLLAAEVAHEIRNPLTVMQMLFHALVESMALDDKSQRDASLIAEKMRQMNRILDQVLSFARSSEPTKESVHARQLFDDVFLLTRHKLLQQGIDIRIHVPENLPLFDVDREQVEQVLLNLILNAAQAMPQGGALRLSASVEEFEGESFLVLAVRDNGAGMSQEQIDNLFAPFLTTKDSGTGIGLAIVKKIMENHQSKVQVESKLGQGTKFKLLFPIADGHAAVTMDEDM